MLVIKKVNIGVEKRRNIMGVGQIKVKIKFFLDPAVKGLNNWVICGSSPSRHGTKYVKYVIIVVGLAKSP